MIIIIIMITAKIDSCLGNLILKRKSNTLEMMLNIFIIATRFINTY